MAITASSILRPVPVRMTLPSANPGWNTGSFKIPTASQHGWSGSSLQSYLQTFQRGGGPAPGQQIATTQSLFPGLGSPVAPDWNSIPSIQPPAVNPSGQDIVQSLVKNSVGGEMSPAAASLYGRMLGATPPPAVAATPSSSAQPNSLAMGTATQSHLDRVYGNSPYQSGFTAGQESLYKGMTPLQKAQANAVYNVTQPASPPLQ